jgi:hypothetical protein
MTVQWQVSRHTGQRRISAKRAAYLEAKAAFDRIVDAYGASVGSRNLPHSIGSPRTAGERPSPD